MLQSAYVFTAFGNGALDPTGPETTPDTGGYRVFRGNCWFHESDYCRAARYTTSIFLFVLLANSDLADTVGVAHLPSIPTDRRYRHCSPPHWLFFEPGRRCSLRSSPSATNLAYCLSLIHI